MRGILEERQTRSYLAFILLLAAAMVAAACLLGWRQTDRMRALYFQWEGRVSSGLLGEGVEPAVIARAFAGTEVTAEGERFLLQAGYTEETTPLWLLPDLYEAGMRQVGGQAAVFGGLSLLLLMGTLLFLGRRQRLYERAAEVMGEYAGGNFSRHLPRNERGTLFRMFASAEQLATALQARSQARQAEKEMMKETLSDISHQLKTPLSALFMYMEIMEGEPEEPSVVREFSGKALKALERIQELIQTLLKVARLDAGAVAFEKEDWPVGQLAGEAAEQLLDRACKEEKQLLLQGEERSHLVCDRSWMREALSNLIKNALDHTDPGGVIRVRWEESPAMLRIFVEDNGHGIPPEDIHFIFRRFYRSSRSSDREGCGLGLPLAKSVIEGQGGVIQVESRPGRGSRFIISFPGFGTEAASGGQVTKL